jgi:hypothetical protein
VRGGLRAPFRRDHPVARPSPLSDDERAPLSHQTADEVDVAAEPVELRGDDRAFQLAGHLEGRGKLRPALKRVSALTGLDLGESIYDVAALGSGKPGNGIALGLEAKPSGALLLGWALSLLMAVWPPELN